MTLQTGHFEGKTYIFPIRIYYEDTDLSQLVYHAKYVHFFERARTELLRALGISQASQLEQPDQTVWTIRTIEIEYLHPARIDDLIEVHTSIKTLTGARLVVEQTIYCDEIQLTKGTVELCMITLDGKLKRIPQHIKEKLAILIPA